LTLIAVAAARGGAAARAAFALIAVLSVAGSISAHAPSSHEPDLGGAFAHAGRHWRPGDHLALRASLDSNLVSAPLVIYYADRYLPPGTRVFVQPPPRALLAFIRRHRRLWLVDDTPSSGTVLDDLLRGLGARAGYLARYPGSLPLQLVLVVPRG
jgi:hypothetical protein